MKHRVPVFAAILLILCSSWGFLVHRTVNQLAVYHLPGRMQPFFEKEMEYIVRHSVRPDLRRNEDSLEASRHFIDLEAYGDSAAWKMPVHWEQALQQFPKDTLLKYGYVPYWVMEIKKRLTEAFRRQDRDSILFYAADLGHYIGDAHVPLHTSINYDGQLSGQKGLHALWESVVPEIEIDQYRLRSGRKARYLSHPEYNIWLAIRQAHVLLPAVFENERKLTLQFTDSTKYRIQKRNGRDVKYYTTAFAQAYAASLEPTINQQLLRASDLIADFWYTAWVDAGKPDLERLLANPVTKEEKKKWKAERKAYKKEKLIEKGLLVAKKEGGD